MARFTLEIGTPPEVRTITSVPANDWATLTEHVTGLEAGDTILQASFTVKRAVADADDASTSVQRTIIPEAAESGQITNNEKLLFYFRPADTLKMVDAHYFDLQVWVSRGSEVYIRTIVKGRITAVTDITNTTVLLSEATQLDIVGDLPLTGSPGDFFQLLAEVRDADDNLVLGLEPVWTSSNPMVASVDDDGLVFFWTTGSCTITVSLPAYSLSDLETATVTDAAFTTANEGDIPTYRSGAWTPENPSTRFAAFGHTHTFASLTSKPTTIGGFGITDFDSLGDARWSPLGHTHTFASLTSKPTTISGFGITDFETSGDARWSLLAHTHTFASLTSKPTTIGGYGISDFNSLGDARWSLLAHTHTFASLTSKPTTIIGYGIGDGRFAGDILADADNTYDIGKSGATRFRDLFLSRNFKLAGDIDLSDSKYMRWTSSGATASVKTLTMQVADNGGGNVVFEIQLGGVRVYETDDGGGTAVGYGNNQIILLPASGSETTLLVRDAATSLKRVKMDADLSGKRFLYVDT